MVKQARTVGQLKALIADLPDNMAILRSGCDHDYIEARIVADTVTYCPDTDDYMEYWKEYSKEDYVDFGVENAQFVQALIVE